MGLRTQLKRGASEATRDQLWTPVATPVDLPWEDGVGMGWMLGRHRAHRLVHHAGMDPGFGARVALVPQASAGVIVLANSNAVLTGSIILAALDVALGDDAESAAAGADLRTARPSVIRPVAATLSTASEEVAARQLRELLTSIRPLTKTTIGS